MVIIGSNLASGNAARHLGDSTQALQKSLGRLSSGSKLNNASDDAAGSAVSLKLDSQISRLSASKNNVGNAIPAGILSLRSSSGTRSAEKNSCIAGKWNDEAVATIEIQFDCELSKSLPEADELKQVSIGHLSELLELNSSFVCLNTENCGWMIAFPIAEVD